MHLEGWVGGNQRGIWSDGQAIKGGGGGVGCVQQVAQASPHSCSSGGGSGVGAPGAGGVGTGLVVETGTIGAVVVEALTGGDFSEG